MGSQGQRSLGFVLLTILLSLQVTFAHSSNEIEKGYASEATTTSDQAQLTPYSLLRHRRREASAASEAERRTSNVAASPRIDSGEDLKNSRIVDGTDAGSAYPFFVLWGGCGATLIHNDIALSAAHCSSSEEAQIGPENRYDASNTSTRVVKVRRHPSYDPENFEYDFAVLKLNGWFQSKTVRLNGDEDSPEVGESLRILGFGGQSSTLKEGSVDAISPSICAFQWRRAGYVIDESTVVCANSDEGTNPCTGDSGGPLLSSSNVQVGVISSGSECDGSMPSIYSRVSAAKSWMKRQICKMSDFPPEECLGPYPREPFGTEAIRVDILLDDYPEDIRWRITSDGGDERTVEVASGGDFEVPNSLESRFVYLQIGAYYDFTIEDISDFSDGLGSKGKYSVVLVNSRGNDKKILVSGGGNFKRSASSTFLIGNTPKPTQSPTDSPTKPPTPKPTFATPKPITTNSPSANPTKMTLKPTKRPTKKPTPLPTKKPTPLPTKKPTAKPTDVPTTSPTNKPTRKPRRRPTSTPTDQPTTSNPTRTPTKQPTRKPTKNPTIEPTNPPTAEPTESPTPEPTDDPTPTPTPVKSSTPSSILEVYGFERRSLQGEIDSPTTPPTGKPTISFEPSISSAPSRSQLPSQSPTTSSIPTTDSPTITNGPTIPEDTEPPVLSSSVITLIPGFLVPPTLDPSPTLVPTIANTESSPMVAEEPTIPKPTQPPAFPPSAIEFLFPSFAIIPRTLEPTTNPTLVPTRVNTGSGPGFSPSVVPTSTMGPLNTDAPSLVPVNTPSVSPSTRSPIGNPSDNPSASPTSESSANNPVDFSLDKPTNIPSALAVTKSPTSVLSESPTDNPSASPTTMSPTAIPLVSPVETPSVSPTTKNLTPYPSVSPVEDTSAVPSTKSPASASSDSPTENLSMPPTTKSPTAAPSYSPVDNPSAPSTTKGPTTVPSKSPTDNPSVSPTTKIPTTLPSNSPIDNPSASPTAAVPSDSPTAAPSESPIDNLSAPPSTKSPTADPSDSPTSDPSASPTTKNPTESPTEAPSGDTVSNPSASPTTKSPTGKPTTDPTDSPTFNPSASPTTKNPTGKPTEVPTISPTDMPTTAQPTPGPTDTPVVPLRRYMGFVNVTIFENPEEISWRIIDAITQEQFYRYPSGNYLAATTFTNFLNLETGVWEFQLSRESLSADAMAEVGYLNILTGAIESLGSLTFASNSTGTTVSTLFPLM